MPLNAEAVRAEIERITASFIENSLCNRQNFPAVTNAGGLVDVGFSGGGSLSIALKDVPYSEVYDAYDREGSYNFKMLDGALIQLLYRFRGDQLESHRLAFFPSPYLDQFQNEPEIYEADDVFAEVVSRAIVAFPVRFDFSSDDALFVDVHHPTLGQYRNCRIPVSSPLAPFDFVDFILRAFYNTAHRVHSARLPPPCGRFEQCISIAESDLVHLLVRRRAAA
jgi:hypothetical protein